MHYNQQRRQKTRQTKEEKGRDRLRRQTETAEREARSINPAIYICDIDAYIKTLLNRLARHT